MTPLKLNIELSSYWHVGSGKEAGAYADQLALVDHNQLPYLPGRSIKGVLRHAFTTAEAAGWFSNDQQQLTNTLFGHEGADGQGALRISNGHLEEEVQHFLSQHSEHRKQLFEVLTMTAIDKSTGAVEEGSLRTIEVVTPLQLSCQVAVAPEFSATEWLPQLKTWLQQVTPLITGIGAMRNKGLGQCHISIAEA